ncbi:Regulatory protein AfsR [Actinosynnema sp. ALI-1.44]
MTGARDVEVEFGVLGALTAAVRGVPVALTGAKSRIVLASLLLRPGRPVSTDELVERLWDVAPARGARNTTQSYVMRLRTALGDAGRMIRTHPSGYVADVPETSVDLWRFREHVRRAGAAGDARAQSSELAAGLALWRGAPLADVPSEFLQRNEVPALVEERLQAVERRIDVDLELGRHAGLVAELQKLTTEHRLREHFWHQLMLALVRSERQADALAAYRAVSALLREELGVEPGEPLQRLHHRILNGEAGGAAPPPPPPDRWPVPRQLPAGLQDFTGRDAEARRVEDIITSATRAVPVVVLSGPPGVGKTALALHVAHRVAQRFPDGQLHLDLRGYSTSPPVSATDALNRLLRALGTPPELVPHDLDDQSALFRSKLADRRVLLVLDNAVSADQIRPLLPGSATCAVLVTSRDKLVGLVALGAAQQVPVDLVSPEDARKLLTTLLGEERTAAEPRAVDEFAALCGYLPLALRIAAANLTASPGLGIADYVDRVRRSDRLDEMSIAGDDQAAVHWAFDRSYSVLKPEPARLFRLLSLAPGPDFDRFTAAELAGVAPEAAAKALTRLATANLVFSRAAGRYQFHDLIGEFARKKCETEDAPEERRRAVRRLFESALDTARAAEAVAGRRTPPPARRPRPGLATPAEALAWFQAETPNLVALVREAAHDHPELLPWRLADALVGHFERLRLDTSWRVAFDTALTAARERGDRVGWAEMEDGLGRLGFLQARYDDARTHYLRAVDLFRASADPAGEARSLTGLGSVAFDRGAYEEAITRYGAAAELFRAVPDAPDQVRTLYNLAVVLMMSGDTDRAVERFAAAGRLAEALDMPLMRARTAAGTATADLWRGRHGEAAAGFTAVLAVVSELAYPQYRSETLRSLAEVALEEGDLRRAADLGRQALAVADSIESPWHEVGARVILGRAALGGGDPDAAFEHFRVARGEASARVRHWHASATRGLAEWHRRAGSADAAVELAAAVLDDPRPRERGRTHAELASALLAKGDHRAALHHAELAAGIGRAHGYRLDEVQALAVVAELHRVLGDDTAAERARARSAGLLADDRGAPPSGGEQDAP